MKWTKELSRRAVAARLRRRLARAESPAPAEPRRYVPRPRLVPDFTIDIRARTGERARITATRMGRGLLTGEGRTTARRVGRGIEALLRHFFLPA